MGTISRQYTFIAGAIPSAANWNADPNNFITLANGQIDEANVDYASADGIATLQNTQTISGTKTFSSSGGATFNYGITINDGSNDSDTRIETNNMANAVVVDAGLDAISFGAAAVDDSFVQIAKGATSSTATQNTYHLSVAPGGATTIPAGTTAYVGSVNINEPNITATGTVTNAFTVRIAGAPTEGGTTNYALWVDAGATQLDGTLSVGVDGTGADVTFYGDTSGKQALWDQSEDTLQLNDSTNLTFGTGADADIFYDGTDLNISPAVVGSGDIVVNGASMEFADSEGVTFGTGKDATIQYDGTNLVIAPAAVGSGDVSISGGGLKLADSEAVTLGTGSDATILFDATNTVVATAAQLVLTPTTDTIFSNGTGVVVGHTAQATVGNIVPEMQVLGTAAADTRLLMGRFSADASPATIQFSKSRDPAIFDGSFAIVADDDAVGSVSAYVDDGTDLVQSIASIDFVVDDGSPAENAVGGSIEFYTTNASGTGRLAAVIAENGDIIMTNAVAAKLLHGDVANAGSTYGATFQQGGYDDEILSLKSTDVAHGITSRTETDTYLYIKKGGAANGRPRIEGLSDGGGGLDLSGITSTVNTTHTAGGDAAITANAGFKNGTGIQNMSSGGNIFGVGDHGTGLKFIVDAEGDLFADGSATTVYDDRDDMALLSAFDRDTKGFIEQDWEQGLAENEKALIDIGILGGPRVGVPVEERGLISYTGLARLHNSALRQVYTRLVETVERLTVAENKLKMLGA